MDGLDFGSFECDLVVASDSITNGCWEGAVKTGWTCQGGTYTTPDVCTEICGDGNHFLSTNNACDDGNIYDDDGCSSSCVLEEGFYEYDIYGNNEDDAQIFYELCDGYDYGYLDCDCDTDLSGTNCDGCSNCAVTSGYRC